MKAEWLSIEFKFLVRSDLNVSPVRSWVAYSLWILYVNVMLIFKSFWVVMRIK